MRSRFFVAALLFTQSVIASASSSYVISATTLAAQTANNTSAADSFVSQTNGNRGAGNVSKLDIHSLLYPGATTKIYAHLLTWFGPGAPHMNIGYSSTDVTQVKRQVEDMISRGIDGVIIDWYGPNNSIDQGAKLIKAEAENHPGFTFAVMIDQGAIQWNSCSGCTPQQALVHDLQYIESTYFISPAYMKEQGQPVITNFDVDLSYSVDWNAATAALSVHPFYIFQNNNGFSHVASNGSYSWVMPTTADYGLGYLGGFYSTGISFPAEQTVGATYKGFNDTLAAWGSQRVMNQQCGQTWLQTFSKLNSLYSSGKQLPDLQLVTWNDYEEATELESGIDNCLNVTASTSANALQWALHGDGNENTVDHYTVYISSDGQDLMPLADMQTGVYSLNLCSFGVPTGSYKLYVQAVGKPSLANQMSGAVNYSPTCDSTNQSIFSVSATPSTVTVPAGKNGSVTVIVNPNSGTFHNPVSLSCLGLPATLACSFAPANVIPGPNSVASQLTISPVAVTSMTLPGRRQGLLLYGAWLLPFGIAGITFVGGRPCRRRLRVLAVAAILAIGMVTISCGAVAKPGGVSASAAGNKATHFAVTVQGASGSNRSSTVVNLVIQ
jgi:hypothetical protein